MKLRLAILLSGLVLLFSCTKPETVIELPDQPQGYQELLTAYNSGYTYLKTQNTTSYITILFKEKELSLSGSSLKVHDHTVVPLPPIGLSKENGMWTISGQLCGIKDHSSLSDEQACPVYVWFDKQTFHMIISNGHRLDYNFVQKEPLRDIREFRIPVIKINTEGGAPVISKDDYLNGTVSLTDPDGTYSKETSFTAETKIKGRGNSTWGMPKKPYRLKLSEKASLLGMPASKNWALLANYSDKSLVRNKTAMVISEIAGMSWTPKMVPVEVYLNGEYLGLYDLCEHKEVSKSKVNINVVGKDAITEDEIQGDYYLELDENMDETTCFYTSKGMPMMFSDPEVPNDAQLEYVQGYFNDFEKALYGSDFKDPVKGYAAYIDVESFINNYIIQELAKNIDGNLRRSTYITKEKGKKLTIYHIWDFDLAFGNADYFTASVGNGPTNWWVRNYGPYGKNSGWYARLFEDPGFRAKVKSRWADLYPELERIPEHIDIMVAELGGAPARNFSKWNILKTYVWPNVKITGSYPNEIDYLKDFYTQRLEWLDKQMNAL